MHDEIERRLQDAHAATARFVSADEAQRASIDGAARVRPAGRSLVGRRMHGLAVPLVASSALVAVVVAGCAIDRHAARSDRPETVLTGPIPSTAPESTLPSQANISIQPASPPVTALPSLQTGPPHPVVGVGYPFDLYRHCGLGSVAFGGRMWASDAPVPTAQPDANGTTTDDGYTHGTMVLADQNTLRFTYAGPAGSPPIIAILRPTTASLGLCA